MKTLSFGEILFDIYPDNKIIGGAPLNLASHLAKLGVDSRIISAVGNDCSGRNALEQIKSVGVNDSFVAITDFPTGYSIVTFKDKKPCYALSPDCAFDHIPAVRPDGDYDVFCFGTLAQRNEDSRSTLHDLLDNGSFREVFCDINIRDGFNSVDTLEYSLSKSSIVKLSREESPIFKALGISEQTEAMALAENISDKYSVHTVIVTLDKDGALVYSNKSKYRSVKPTSRPLSTVGAGDSFSACFLYNYLCGVSIQMCLDRGVMLSDFVVTQPEAVPDYPEGLLHAIKD
ncbi:MAG TPA: PfkB family carbohydrate kinase [Bacillota bacterium]|nr:PfkB family carbohydrate kinase [Bacillota bacterium]